MIHGHLQLRRVVFRGVNRESHLQLGSGVNVICGASDTGKSFLAETIDFMLGGSKLRQINELASYGEIELHLSAGYDELWRIRRSTSGGNFSLASLASTDQNESILNQKHTRDETDNLSGFLLEKIGLLGKTVLTSSSNATTRSLSFRDLARLAIVQEDEIHKRISPFWTGQFTTKTVNLATVKLLLTGIDDASVVSALPDLPVNGNSITIIDELLADLARELESSGADRTELLDQIERLDTLIAERRHSLDLAQRQLDNALAQRRLAYEDRNEKQDRLREIHELLARFDLLRQHYAVDIDRLRAIRESGSLFVHVDVIPCPLCGAKPDAQHLDSECDGNVDSIVSAAASEIQKIEKLMRELEDTVSDLRAEAEGLGVAIAQKDTDCQQWDAEIQKTMTIDVRSQQSSFAELVEARASIQKRADLFERHEKLQERKASLQDVAESASRGERVRSWIPDTVAHALSMKLSSVLKSWNFPGACHVHFDKTTIDFVIDGKHRVNRGKGLRAITHAAVNIALLEFCQERGLPHPGFVLLDSPLLAYFKPEGDDDYQLQGTDLKERFYEYLAQHHGRDSQIVIIENQHPAPALEHLLAMTVFTGNPANGRYGLL
ncbi:hypothetical protein C7S18_23810 (plasmid) [Ahniella affigens]|uniref:Uncharacterized protein n=1 Tax=Ahniella affigens TaxID=2021234 RepID=A0A2P1PZR6_9GAMM|nr:AAA family ATPase [Ahniella affigens]AVQ00327.1 hypothetical protein C7S18_23810 [Ahniella affigens]